MIQKTPEEKAAIKAAKKAYKQNNSYRRPVDARHEQLDQESRPKPILTGLVECENILPDDYPVYWDYLYVAEQKDGNYKVIRSDIKGTIKQLKYDIFNLTGFMPPNIYNCKHAARNIF